ncbi:MAG: SUMF1/EgtB/PvdO family nonheme iron enzyme [Pseudomonadota bacterium]|nr:SUMF1/EgtB/PvdO family nonheme iron enzyme [Pseudomonadota bacterium]
MIGNWPRHGRLTGPRRVLRGGSWNNNSENARAANRNRNTPSKRNSNNGFRVARSASTPRHQSRVLQGERGRITGSPGPARRRQHPPPVLTLKVTGGVLGCPRSPRRMG